MHQLAVIFNSVISFLNINSGAILAITTLVYAIITGRMLFETKRMRESQTEPFVFINVQPHEKERIILNMVIQNIGPGPAYDLTFKIKPDVVLPGGHNLSEINMMKQGLNYLAPNQKVECLVAFTKEETKEEKKILHYVTVYYKNKNKRSYEHTYEMDFTEYVGREYVEFDKYKKIVDKLDAIYKGIDKASSKLPHK